MIRCRCFQLPPLHDPVCKIETGPGLTCSFLIRQLLEEADLDESGSLSYVDFEKVMDRAPEFMK